MQPPPFETPQGMPRKKNNALPFLIIGGVLVCCIGPIALMGGLGYAGFKGAQPIIGCTIAMTGISSALRKYSEANGGKLPPAESWQTAIAPYYDKSLTKDEAGPFTIPNSKEPFGCGEGKDKTAFVFNAQYGGKKLAEIPNASDAVLVYETNGPARMNASGTYKDLGKAASPKIFNAPRGWFAVNGALEIVTVEDGRMKTTGAGRRFRASATTGSGVKVETGSGSGSDTN